jgi:hydrogenase maturation protein HypF
MAYALTLLGDIPDLPAFAEICTEESAILARQVEQRINTPLTSSMGRLFDAVSAILGLSSVSTFEGQAAIILENAASKAISSIERIYPFVMKPDGTILLGELLRCIVTETQAGKPVNEIALVFHHTIAAMILQCAEHLRNTRQLNAVALSGGVLQNRLLTRLIHEQVYKSGFAILEHQLVPANDGGLSLGQAAIAACRFADAQ